MPQTANGAPNGSGRSNSRPHDRRPPAAYSQTHTTSPGRHPVCPFYSAGCAPRQVRGVAFSAVAAALRCADHGCVRSIDVTTHLTADPRLPPRRLVATPLGFFTT